MQYPEYVKIAIERLYESGECAYIVGGSVRDMLLGCTPHDYDITTSALPQKTAEIFSDMNVIETGLAHGTVTVVCLGQPLEITTFRIDGEYTDCRHPDEVRFTRKLECDLSRRDFTVNAMAYNQSEGLVDIFGGRDDLDAHIIRAVGDAEQRFEEDALRILRAFRFCAQLDFEIHTDTLRAAKKKAQNLRFVARERVANEFLRLICSPAAARALHLMSVAGVLEYVLGEDLPDSALFDLLLKMPQRDYARLGLLLSGHDAQSARDILNSLRASNKLKTGTLAVLNGCRYEVATPTDARHLLARCGIYAPEAALVGELLGICASGAYELTLREQSKPHSLRDLGINGKDLAAMGVSGKQIGRILEAILAEVIEHPEINTRDGLLALARQYTEGNGVWKNT